MKNQSNADWWNDYDNGGSCNVEPRFKNDFSIKEAKAYVPKLVFRTHRTTHQNRLILEFKDQNTKEIVIAFFNVNIHKHRCGGNKECYLIGAKGQFLPPKLGKFRDLWMDAVGYEPRRWSRAHQELNARFKNKIFTGRLSRKDSNKNYIQVYELRIFK